MRRAAARRRTPRRGGARLALSLATPDALADELLEVVEPERADLRAGRLREACARAGRQRLLRNVRGHVAEVAAVADLRAGRAVRDPELALRQPDRAGKPEGRRSGEEDHIALAHRVARDS